MKSTLRCNPFDLGLQLNGGEFLGWARRSDEAVQRLKGCLDLGPHFWPARHRLTEVLAARATVHALLGERGPAFALVDELEAAAEQTPVLATDLARLHALLGQADRAFDWIGIGIAQRLTGGAGQSGHAPAVTRP